MCKGIPKVIHYIWFGGGELNELQLKCITSWKVHAPDYTIMCWDESNCNINETAYTSQAYQARKWAFVSDYFRFKVLAKHGGVYMDVDMELHKPLDSLLDSAAFFAFETQDVVHAGMMGAVANHPTINGLLLTYATDVFVTAGGTLNLSPVPARVTSALRAQRLVFNGKQQTLPEGITVYPANVLTLNRHDGQCIAEHHYEFSWWEQGMKTTHKSYVAKAFTKNGILWALERKMRRTIRKVRSWLLR